MGQQSCKLLRSTEETGTTLNDLYAKLSKRLSNHTVFQQFMIEVALYKTDRNVIQHQN